ncbi:pseudouridine synthase [uncultured Treponema sp.]|uniref:pseudouridine synthase n=1 Tax=uncultured Treponema sp. TaxID=162155 RepID=UPI0025F2F869|nr:pseudouridine synthase [uncultured Treponema sp.]
MKNLQIIHSPTEESPFLIVFKPAGLPSAPLFEGDESALTQAISLFPQIKEVQGKKKVEHGLVHRIDTETNGLVLIATTQKSYDALIQSQKDGKFIKWYRAEVDNIPDCPERLGGFPSRQTVEGWQSLSIESFFRPFGKKGCEVRPVTEDSGRSALKKGGSTLYRTEISFSSENKAVCCITSGYRHQVRCHLAWCGFPVKGDKIYNPDGREKFNEKTSEGGKTPEMKFSAFKVSFPHPLTGVPLTFQM